MKILLINSPTRLHRVVRDMAGGLGLNGSDWVVLPPLDLAYIAATLLNKGHWVKIIDSDAEKYTIEEILQITKECAPDVIIATVSLPTIYTDCQFLNLLRNYTSQLIVRTGITYPPILKEIFERTSADKCVFGECELNIEEIILTKEKTGTSYIENGKLKVEESNIIENLDNLPLPARKLLPNEKYRYILLGDKVTTMQTSRGCPFQCSYYCPYPLVQGKIWRARSPENVIYEIENIVNVYQINKILFRDATFTLNKVRVFEICNLILEKNLKFDWWCETRADRLDYEQMHMMKRAGCQGINIGVETGDIEVIKKQAKPGLTLEKLKEIKRISDKLELKLYFLLMLGLPFETKKSLYATYKLICDLQPYDIGICYVTPYPGTPLYQDAKQNNWLETEDWTKYGGHFPVMRTDNLTTEELCKANRVIRRGFLLSRKGILGNLMARLHGLWFKKWI